MECIFLFSKKMSFRFLFAIVSFLSNSSDILTHHVLINLIQNQDMASQKDIFEDEDLPLRTRMCSTHDPSKKYQYMYEWIVLFDWKVDTRKPFEAHKLSIFNSKDIKGQWIKKNLGVASRILKLTNLSPFPGGVYSIFAKMELGNNQ